MAASFPDHFAQARGRAALVWLAPLLAGKRVALLGALDGELAVRLGAAEVLALHLGPSTKPVGQVAGVRHRSLLGNVIAADDASVDVVIVGDGGDLLRRASLIEELERIRVDDGMLIWLSAAREGTGAGATHARLISRLGQLGTVRVFAQSLLSAMSCVELGEHAIEAVEVDTTLLAETSAAGVRAVLGYVVLVGDISLEARLAANMCLVLERHRSLPSLAEVLATAAVTERTALDAEEVQQPAGAVIGYDEGSALELVSADLLVAGAAAASAASGLEISARRSSSRPMSAEFADLDDDWDPAADAAMAVASSAMASADSELSRMATELTRVQERAEIAEAMHSDVLANREQERGVFERALLAVEAQRDELARLLEESETARAELEAKVAELEGARLESAGFETPHRTKISAVPELLAMVERGADSPEVHDREAGPRLHTAEQRVSRLARIVDELAAGLAHLSEQGRGERPAGFAPMARARELSIDLGVRDAELALLTMGLAALQARVHRTVVEVDELAARAPTQELEPLRGAILTLASRVRSLEGA